MDGHTSLLSGAVEAEPRVRRRLPIEERRTQVLDAALALIATRGYAALSVESIAREAQVSKTVVYNAYGGLAPLLAGLLQREERGALQALADAAPVLEDGADPSAALFAWIVTLADAVIADPTTWRLMLIPPDGTPPMVREHVQRGRDVVLDHARGLTAAILRERFPQEAIDVELAARAVVALAEQGAKLVLEDPAQFTPQRLADFAAAIMRVLPR